MYIWTKDQQILNLDHYARVTVGPMGENVFALFAIDTPESRGASKTYIALFDNELDAKYANCLLFKALIAHAGAWDATAVDLLSQKWEDAKNVNDAGDDLFVALLAHSEMRVTGLQEVTISYSNEIHQKNPGTIYRLRKQIKEKLALDVDIKWHPTDDIRWKQ